MPAPDFRPRRRPASPADAPQALARLWWLCALALAALALLTLAPHLAGAELWRYDEWYSAERVQTILARDDWLTLYENGMPVFKKPPLQYWLSAALIQSGLPDLVALRLPSYLAGFGLVALVAHLAWRLSGGRALAVPVALALLLSSPMFWVAAASPMLDSLAALLLTGALAALLQAWRDPRWWWVVALLTGLGALQKAPVAALAVLLAVALLLASGSRPARPGRGGLAGPLLLALALCLVWPVLQSLLHGRATVETTFLREHLDRFRPGAQDPLRSLRWLFWIKSDAAPLWIGTILASLALPVLRPGPVTRMAAGLVVVFFAALTLAKGELFARYLLQILPLAAAAAGAALASLPARAALAACLAMSLLSGGPIKSAATAGLENPGLRPYRPILADFRAALGPAERPVVCGWGKSDLVIFPGALWLLGSGDRPFRRVWSPDDLAAALDSGNLTPPLRGLCMADEYRALAARLPVTQVMADAGWVHWTLP